MKITKRQLTRLIREELQRFVEQTEDLETDAGIFGQFTGAYEDKLVEYFEFVEQYGGNPSQAIRTMLEKLAGVMATQTAKQYSPMQISVVLKDMSSRGELEGIYDRVGGGAQGAGAIADAIVDRLGRV